MPGPGAVVTALAQGVHRFAVSIPGDAQTAAGTFFFRSVRGLSRTFETQAVSEGGRNFGKRNLWKGPAGHGEITLENGLVSSTTLWAWSRLVDSGASFRKDVTIVHMMGGELNPTAVSSDVTSRMDSVDSKQSITARSLGHSIRSMKFAPNSSRASVVLPLPDGPTMTPICQGNESSSGTSTANDSRSFSASGTSNMPAICCTRKESWTEHSS